MSKSADEIQAAFEKAESGQPIGVCEDWVVACNVHDHGKVAIYKDLDPPRRNPIELVRITFELIDGPITVPTLDTLQGSRAFLQAALDCAWKLGLRPTGVKVEVEPSPFQRAFKEKFEAHQRRQKEQRFDITSVAADAELSVTVGKVAEGVTCVFECREADGSVPSGGSIGSSRGWCRTHGFDCPELRRTSVGPDEVVREIHGPLESDRDALLAGTGPVARPPVQDFVKDLYMAPTGEMVEVQLRRSDGDLRTTEARRMVDDSWRDAAGLPLPHPGVAIVGWRPLLKPLTVDDVRGIVERMMRAAAREGDSAVGAVGGAALASSSAPVQWMQPTLCDQFWVRVLFIDGKWRAEVGDRPSEPFDPAHYVAVIGPVSPSVAQPAFGAEPASPAPTPRDTLVEELRCFRPRLVTGRAVADRIEALMQRAADEIERLRGIRL